MEKPPEVGERFNPYNWYVAQLERYQKEYEEFFLKAELELKQAIRKFAEAVVPVWDKYQEFGYLESLLVHEFERVGLWFGRRPSKTSPKRKKISNKDRWEIFLRDDFRCKHCGDRRSLAVDHIIPVSKGGTDELSNLQTLCRSCNSKKGARI